MLVLLCWVFLAIGAVYGEEEQVDFSDVMTRVILKSKVEMRAAPYDDISPEIDSREHGVAPGKVGTTCRCGVANRRAESRIVGGEEYSQFESPFLAALSYSTRPLSPHCGCVIISANHILTAAHCTEKAKGGIGLFVTIAEHDRGRTPGAYTIPVERLIQHENYDTNNLKNDISLLYLKNPLLFSGAVAPACMPTLGLNITGKYVKAVGWGATRFKGPMTSRPQKVNLRVVSTRFCYQMWPDNIIQSPKSQICTMSKNRTTCQGDSGGPVVWLNPDTMRYEIVGLVSAGPACVDNRPSVHTSVASYLPWIMKGIEATTPGRKLCTSL